MTTRAATRAASGRDVVVATPDGDVVMAHSEVRRIAGATPGGCTVPPAERIGNVLIAACQQALTTLPPQKVTS